ncbi:MAG TPA: pre-16S rRNA-processing nuclease YqgF [Limnochordia bacterium]|nr:pre-16S rRNA-processing nuclease YqgF [Limnochordia bacterium]
MVGVDPGRDKAGVARVGLDGVCLERRLVAAAQTIAVVVAWCRDAPMAVAVGDRTGGAALCKALQAALGDRAPVVPVDEHRSTLEGRALYWRVNPPRGWRRLLPLGLLTPPEPVDAYVAEVIARRYLAKHVAPEQEAGT